MRYLIKNTKFDNAYFRYQEIDGKIYVSLVAKPISLESCAMTLEDVNNILKDIPYISKFRAFVKDIEIVEYKEQPKEI